ncbi:hypothetical protein NZK33_02730 [Cyanobium sp. FGCU-6]|nr:hypothetical protein [Cyanobium sp. FGCU6]
MGVGMDGKKAGLAGGAGGHRSGRLGEHQAQRHPRQARRVRLSPQRLGVIALLGLLLPACSERRETLAQGASAGDLLVKAGQTRVELVAPFQPGVANGLYKGVIRVSQPGGESQLFRVNGICSIKGQPGWPTYDNLFGDPLRDASKLPLGASPQRWQVFYHFDGRIESNNKLTIQPWMARLKDNLCRRGDFDDRGPGRMKSP